MNYNIAAKKRGESITFLRKIVRGPTDDSYGIDVARLAGVPQPVIKRAREILKELEKTGSQSQFTAASVKNAIVATGVQTCPLRIWQRKKSSKC